MSFIGDKIKISGLIISRPVGIILLLIYLAQAAFIGWMVWRYNEREMVITEQAKKIEELEEKVKILDVIQKHQIGFNNYEVSNLTNVIYEESHRFQIDPLLIIAVIISESSFKNHQCSAMGAEGLMQIKPSTGREIAARWGIEWSADDGLFDPRLNIQLGTAYLFELIWKFKDIEQAITAYKMGETMTMEYLGWGIELPDRYFGRVKRIHSKLRGEFEDKENHQGLCANFPASDR
jgi:soluble lytic murein transglycosylase